MAPRDPKLDTSEARQGSGARANLRVLIIALVLAAIAFAVLGIYGVFLPEADMAVSPGENTSSEVEAGGVTGDPAMGQ